MNIYQLILTIYAGVTLFAVLVVFALCMAARRADVCIVRKQRGRVYVPRMQGSAGSASNPQREPLLLRSDSV